MNTLREQEEILTHQVILLMDLLAKDVSNQLVQDKLDELVLEREHIRGMLLDAIRESNR
jgi:hypothetical protein